MRKQLLQEKHVNILNNAGTATKVFPESLRSKSGLYSAQNSNYTLSINIPQIKLESTSSEYTGIKKYSLSNSSGFNIKNMNGLYVRLTCYAYSSETLYNNSLTDNSTKPSTTYNVVSQILNNAVRFSLSSSSFITINIIDNNNLEIYYKNKSYYCLVIKEVTALYDPDTLTPYTFNYINDTDKAPRALLEPSYIVNCKNYLQKENFCDYVESSYIQELNNFIFLHHRNTSISVIYPTTSSTEGFPNIYGEPYPFDISSNGYAVKPIVYELNKYFSVNPSNNRVYYSSHPCNNWTGVTLSNSGSWSNPVNINGTLLIYPTKYRNQQGVFTGSGGQAIAYSTNGTAWTEVTLPKSACFYNIAHNNGSIIMLYNTSYMIVSTDKGKTWSEITSWTNILEVQYDDKSQCFIATSDGNQIKTSTDGISWKVTEIPSITVTKTNGNTTTRKTYSVYFDTTSDGYTKPRLFFKRIGSEYVFLPLYGQSYNEIMLYSSDLISWEIRQIPDYVNRIDVLEFDTETILVGLFYQSYKSSTQQTCLTIMTSKDLGKTWTSPYSIDGTFASLTTQGDPAGNTIVLSGILRNGIEHGPFYYNYNSAYDCAGPSNNDDKTLILYSTDRGTTWKTTHLPDDQFYNKVQFKNGTFIAMPYGDDDNYNYAYSRKLAYSFNGYTWYSADLPYMCCWHNVIYSNAFNQWITMPYNHSSLSYTIPKYYNANDLNYKNQAHNAIIGIPTNITRTKYYRLIGGKYDDIQYD